LLKARLSHGEGYNRIMTFNEVIELVKEERELQDNKWGRGNGILWSSSSAAKLTVLAEEFGEVARAILEVDPENLRDELIDVAATCFAWLESDFFVGESHTI
jgi:NTP pyrophosphatase (non-canonical NTP hydrolase)